MIQNYKIVTLCGSTRFKDQFLEAQKRLTLEGCIVIGVGLFGHSGDDEVWKPGTKEMLDDMHLRKIDLADEISLSSMLVDISAKVPGVKLPMLRKLERKSDIWKSNERFNC